MNTDRSVASANVLVNRSPGEHRRRSAFAVTRDAVRLEHRGAARRLGTGVDALVGRLVLRRHELGFDRQYGRKKESRSSHGTSAHDAGPAETASIGCPIVPEVWEDPNQGLRMRLVEEYAGVGDLSGQGRGLRQVRYRIARYQAFSAGNGLPIPGLHRIEGAIDLPQNEDVTDLVGATARSQARRRPRARCHAGRHDGRVLSEGHGPSRCLCC